MVQCNRWENHCGIPKFIYKATSDVVLAISHALSVLEGSHVSKGRKRCRKYDARISRDAMLLAEIGLIHTVDLGNGDFALLERSRGLFIVRSECLAVPAPGKRRVSR